MTIDQPVINYNYKKNKGKKSMIATKQEESEMDILQKAWEGKRKGKTYVGNTFSLSEFMKEDIKH